MRTGAGFTSLNARPSTHYSPAATPSTAPHNTWHSPVPYLFGGLAAMLGLIAFALLILACSYWRLSNYLDAAEEGDANDHRGGDGKQQDPSAKPPPCFGEGFVVIMAGDEKPTFLATPILRKASDQVETEDGKSTTKEEETVTESAVSDQGGDRNSER